jgi:hypothetical protein
MSVNTKLGGFAERVRFICVVAFCAIVLAPMSSGAQESDHDHELNHEHEYLHFSHPMVTESPSPDTKFRFDATFLHADEPVGARATEMRGEFEYAFARTFSLAVVAPFVRITSPSDARTSGLGNVELSAKAASFAFAHSGALVGAGLTLGLPTGSDAKGTGSDHLYEISPFVDAALRKGPVELVGFLTYSALANRNAGDANEREVTFDGSVLWRAAEELELLAELSTSRSYGGAESAYTQTFLAPGIKWRPAKFEKVAIGASAIRGVGSASGVNAVQLSAFYHF